MIDIAEREQLERGIAALEAQRAVLGDTVVDTLLAPLRERLAQTTTLPITEQRKQVTVLFADTSGFTAMSETMDPEDLHDLMNDVWARLDAIIVAHGGRIDKHAGDAVMAVWGVPTAHEDDPEQAIHAALAIQKALGERTSHLTATGHSIAMRIGINTGPVVLGSVGGRAEYTALGDTVNVASRLETAAPVGGILISHDTYRHVRGVFSVQPLPPITVRGKAEPLQVYVVERAKPHAFRIPTRGVEGVETPTIGRDEELLHLQAVYDTACAESLAHLVTIVGEAGVGKSRLLYEFQKWLELRPHSASLFRARALSETTSLPYAFLRQMFAFRFEIYDSDTAAEARAKMERGIIGFLGPDTPDTALKAHFLGQLVGFDFSTSPHLQGLLGDARQLRERALSYLADVVRAAATQQPVVMLLEDVHWADDASLDAIQRLLTECAELPLLILALARPTLFERRPTWGDDLARSTQLNLDPLSPAESRRLVVAMLVRLDALPVDLSDRIAAAAEGNPFFMEEIVKMLIEDGVIVKGDETWHVAADRLADLRVPATLTGVVQARLDSLASDERVTLQRASVVGRVFWDTVVAQLAEPPAPLTEVDATLHALEVKEMVFARDVSAFGGAREHIFKHSILRDVTYETVLKRERRHYHALVAAWLVAQSGERVGEFAGLIADHYERAEALDEALHYLRLAGEQAFTVSAFREGVTFYHRALALATDDATRVALHIRLGETLSLAGDFTEATDHLETAVALARAAGDSRSLARARAEMARIATFKTGDFQQAQVYLQEGLAAAQAADDQCTLALILRQLGNINIVLLHLLPAVEYLTASLAAARTCGDAYATAMAMNSLSDAYSRQGRDDDALTYARQVVDIGHATGNRRVLMMGLAHLGLIARDQGDYAASYDDFHQALDICRGIGDPEKIATVSNYNGDALILLDRLTEAWAVYLDALRVSMEAHVMPQAVRAIAGLASVAQRQGRTDEALAWLGMVTTHPAYGHEAHDTAHLSLPALQAALPADDYTRGLARGAALSLDDVARQILQST